MNNRRLEIPKLIIEYRKCENLIHYQAKISLSFMLIEMLITIYTLNKFY